MPAPSDYGARTPNLFPPTFWPLLLTHSKVPSPSELQALRSTPGMAGAGAHGSQPLVLWSPGTSGLRPLQPSPRATAWASCPPWLLVRHLTPRATTGPRRPSPPHLLQGTGTTTPPTSHPCSSVPAPPASLGLPCATAPSKRTVLSAPQQCSHPDLDGPNWHPLGTCG